MTTTLGSTIYNFDLTCGSVLTFCPSYSMPYAYDFDLTSYEFDLTSCDFV